MELTEEGCNMEPQTDRSFGSRPAERASSVEWAINAIGDFLRSPQPGADSPLVSDADNPPVVVEHSTTFTDLETAFQACRGAELLNLVWTLDGAIAGEWTVTIRVTGQELSSHETD